MASRTVTHNPPRNGSELEPAGGGEGALKMPSGESLRYEIDEGLRLCTSYRSQ